MKHLLRWLTIVACFAAVSATTAAQDTQFHPENQQIPGHECNYLYHLWDGAPQPGCRPNAHAHWLYDLRHWRSERLIRIAYDGSRYSLPEFQWTQSSFIQPQAMVHDRTFFDPVAGRYTVDRYLDDLDRRYGGIDSVLVWATYPNMGLDDRNQLDMVASMPGGIEGVRQMVADFHRHGVRVLFPMMMWDQGTREPGKPWPQALADLMKAVGADGVNGDTQDGVPLGFTLAAEQAGHPLVFEPEQSPSDEALAWNVMTWGQYSFPFTPMVDRYKWLEPRHMVHISDRWNRDKTNDLQYAFFNGVGWESWENIWGIWNGINARDAEATRRVATIERGIAKFLVSPGWEPLYPTHTYGVFASSWPIGTETAWTVVNRNDFDLSGRQLDLPAAQDMRYFDLYHGGELKPEVNGDIATLSLDLEAHGFGAVLATPGPPSAAIQSLMKRMSAMTARPLASWPRDPVVLKQTMVEIASTPPVAEAPEGMVRIPGGPFTFKVEGTEIEGVAQIGVDVQYPWEDAPRRFHEHAMTVAPFFIDKYPVTNAQFKRFLDATHYAPKDPINFLRDWKNGTYPAGWENRPVTWVSLEDARAYAAWAGKRLPHEWEWQFAAQGTDGRMYPWGSQWIAANVPDVDHSRHMRGPDPVDAHPAGASPYGVMDLVGNVWQWTDEFVDEHTRAAIVRGSEYYQPQGSLWYFPQALRNSQHSKVLLMAPGYDRSGGIGFRCVRDAR